MRRHGIVLELHPDSAIVLSRDGEFCRIPRTAEMLVGVEVAWEAPAISGRFGRLRGGGWFRAPWGRLSLAGMAASLVAAAGVWFGICVTRPAQAYASVAVDVNPSVCLEVDRNLRVLSAHGNDPDGAALLSELHLQGEPLGAALQEIVHAAGAVRALGSDDAILVSAAPAAGSADLTRVQQAAESALMQLGIAGMKAPHLYTITLSPAIWQAADAAKISPGRLAAYLVAEKEGFHVQSVNDLSGPSLVRVLSDPAAAPVLQVLSAADMTQLERFIDSLHLPAGGPTASSNRQKGSAGAGAAPGQTTNATGGGQGAGSTGNNGTPGRQGDGHGNGGADRGTPGKSSGKQGSGKTGSGNGSSGNDGPGGGGLRVGGSLEGRGEIQVRIGDRVITVPVAYGVIGRLTGQTPGRQGFDADSDGKRHGSPHGTGRHGSSADGFPTNRPLSVSSHGWDNHSDRR